MQEAQANLKVRGPAPRQEPSMEIDRLKRANLVGRYPIIKESTSVMPSSLSEDERIRLFMWGLSEDSKRPHRKCERLPGTNPLTIADSARSYFQEGDAEAEARAADEKAKASLTSKSEAKDPLPRVERSALLKIGGILVTGVVVVGAAYFFYRWWKRPGIPGL